MKQETKIFMLSATDFSPGICSICEQNVEIRFRDNSANLKFGSCCVSFVIQADTVLRNPKLGLRHPEGEETTQMPNN